MVLAIALAVVIPGSAVAMEPPPSQVSGLVWFDSNKNGVRDDGEPGVPGVAVIIRDAQGQQVGTATTDAVGTYATPVPGGGFTVCFGLSGAYADYVFTSVADGCAPGGPTVDAGVVSPPNKLGGAVWADLNKNGVQERGEPWIRDVTVVVTDGRGNQLGTATTDAGGRYQVENLPDGTFTVCFGLSTLPDAYADNLITRPNAGDDIADSDVDQTTGCTAPVNLGPENRENLTVDAGTVAPVNRLGDYVWIDGNRDGIQQPGEPGVLGVTVILRFERVEVARTTTNANGRYLFATMPDGMYQVCVDLTALPAAVASYTVTLARAGDNTALDSDADQAGCTPSTPLGVGNRANFGLDTGLVAVPVSPDGSGSQG